MGALGFTETRERTGGHSCEPTRWRMGGSGCYSYHSVLVTPSLKLFEIEKFKEYWKKVNQKINAAKKKKKKDAAGHPGNKTEAGPRHCSVQQKHRARPLGAGCAAMSLVAGERKCHVVAQTAEEPERTRCRDRCRAQRGLQTPGGPAGGSREGRGPRCRAWRLPRDRVWNDHRPGGLTPRKGALPSSRGQGSEDGAEPPLQVLGEALPASSSGLWPPALLACGRVTPVSAFIFTQLCPL